jgi:hypothetical protein
LIGPVAWICLRPRYDMVTGEGNWAGIWGNGSSFSMFTINPYRSETLHLAFLAS